MTLKTIELPFDGIIETEKAFRALRSGVSFVMNLVPETYIHDSFQTAPDYGGGHRIRLSCVSNINQLFHSCSWDQNAIPKVSTMFE